ncbi:hypothetical protein PIGHUM_02631 [Pigmentiphaga humi]|uniref:Uncharacterized protein n=1 Tax=Pigmentiphaga humi TaxID=2478468 RepID=A0A3P4B5W7_9BURK|nr:hypothetical protein [Pigmentiphaga humi]VCU70555.1 hypothetical protein PIGHUM_02631 [Pigmentiphaga humi]
MSKQKTSQADLFGAEAGVYLPPPTLGDVPPPPRSLRVVVTVALALALLGGTVAVHTVPEVGHVWHVVSHQTGKVLGRVLGRAEQQTAKFVGGALEFEPAAAADAPAPQ